jgi:hypothetical protein
MTDISTFISIAITGAISLLWYLIKQKDDKTSKAIELLWLKHDEDAKALTELHMSVVEEHYKKVELDLKFGKVESAIISAAERAERSSDVLAEKFDKLAETMIRHIAIEEKMMEKK